MRSTSSSSSAHAQLPVALDMIKQSAADLLTKLCRPAKSVRIRKHGKVTTKKKSKTNTAHANEEESDNIDDKATGQSSTVENSVDVMNKIKDLCKTYPVEAPKIICQVLLKHHLLQGQTSLERIKALECAEQLFLRSAKFRQSMCESLRIVLDSAFGPNLPSPHAEALTAYATKLLREWNASFGKFHPQLSLALISEKISLEPLVNNQTVAAAEVLLRNVDTTRVEQVIRAFKIVDGSPLTGIGETEAGIISSAHSKLLEAKNGLTILLPFLQVDQEDVASGAQGLFGTVGDQVTTENSDEEEIEWEEEKDDDDQGQISPQHVDFSDNHYGISEHDDMVNNNSSLYDSVYIPDGYSLQLDQQTSTHNSPMQDVREALLDCRLTMEKSILPELRLWCDSFERLAVSTQHPHDPLLLPTLIRIKRLIQELRTGIEQCDRMGITPRRVGAKPNKGRRPPLPKVSDSVSKSKRIKRVSTGSTT